MTDVAERFYAKVDIVHPRECWIWEGARLPNGYGSIKINQVSRLAHRVSYELWYGEVPTDKVIMHSCDVKACVNPYHLTPGTQRDNVLDKHAKGRAASQRGEHNGAAKLSNEDATAIRQRVLAGEEGKALAVEYGVSRSLVSLIKLGHRRVLK